ncbi:MAG TPA: hypothetical protein VK469_20155 [Candidatus Kapabacteria bacterium]|nr:hypothetical protein [Candidatus Kapabacteria bacterium]
MNTLYYLNSQGINRQVSVPLHFRKLVDIFHQGGYNSIGQAIHDKLLSFKRQLYGGDCKWLYIMAHSDKNKGMMAGETIAINGEKFARMLPPRPERRPELIFFNTCHAVRTGLVEESLQAGVKTVIATDEAIPIQHMCDYAETFFRTWLPEASSLKEALAKTNAAFAGKDIRFEIFPGPSRMPQR